MTVSTAMLRRLMSPSRRPLKHEQSRYAKIEPHMDLRYCLVCARLKISRGEILHDIKVNRHSVSMKCNKCGRRIIPTDPRVFVDQGVDAAGRILWKRFRVPGRTRLLVVRYGKGGDEIPRHPNWGGKRDTQVERTLRIRAR